MEERERREERKGELDWGHDTHERERKEVLVVAGGAEGIWFGASRASFLACHIPGDQHHGVSFHPPPTSTTLRPAPNPSSLFFILIINLY